MNDIFPPVVVLDNSLYIFTGLIVLVVFSIFSLYYFFKKRDNLLVKDEKYYLDLLKKLDMEDVKRSISILEYYLQNLVRTQEQKEEYEEICEAFKAYKYKKNPAPFSQELQQKIDSLLDVLGEKYV